MLQLLILVFLKAQAKEFFVLSDIHYNIGFETNLTFPCQVPSGALGKLRCDTPKEVIESTLTYMQSLNPNPEFIVVLGDSLSHYTLSLSKEGEVDPVQNKFLVRQSHIEVTDLLSRHFPNTQIVQVLGNNDGYANYKKPTEREAAQFYDFLFELWRPFTSISSSFYDGGYYTTHTKDFFLVVLNTNFFSVRNEESKDAQEQLNWLDEQLEHDQQTIVLLHIPPGFEMFNWGEQTWHPSFAESFIRIIQKHQGHIRLILGGHYHNGGFQLIPGTNLGVLLHNSLSGIFFNNPGFRKYTYTPDSLDFSEYSLDLLDSSPNWKYSYAYSELFGTLSLEEALEIEQEEVFDQFIAKSFGFPEPNELMWKVATNDTQNTSYSRQVALCSFKFIKASDFLNCKNKQ